MAVTSKDIADHLGINQSTVSRALQGKLVSKDTIERVRRAARELGYRPNIGARIMATGRTGMYGLLIPRAANLFYGHFIDNIEARALEEDGYHIALGCYMEDFEEFSRYIDLFVRDRRVDGLIVFPMHNPRIHEVLATTSDSDIPIVLYGSSLLSHIHCCGVDHQRGWYQMAKHLVSLGHRRIGVIIDFLGYEPKGLSAGLDGRFSGFMEAMYECGVEWDQEELLVTCKTSVEAASDAARELLSLPIRPTAIFAGNDLLAVGVLSTARKFGLRIPEDISLGGYDNTDFSRVFDLTTVDNLCAETVEAPLGILRKVLSGEAPLGQPMNETIVPQLVVRSSTAAPPA